MIPTDESSIKELGGVEVIMISPNKDILKYGVQLQFPTTAENMMSTTSSWPFTT